MKPKLIYLYFIIIWLSISSASILVRLSNAPGSVCAFWRLLITIFIITPLWIRRKQYVFNYLTILSGVFLGLHFVFWMESLYLIPIVVSTVLVVTYPFYNLLLDYFIFLEEISRVQIICLITGFTAILLYFNPWISSELNYIGLIYALIGGLFAALYFTIGRFLRKYRNIDLVSYVLPTYLIGTIIALLYNFVYRVELYRYSLLTYIYFVLMAIIPMLGGHTLMNYLLKYVKTSTLTSIALGEPVGAGILAYILLGEVIDTYKLILAILIITSLLIINYSEATKKTQ